MALNKAQKFTKTSFKHQADTIASVLRTNTILNDEEKASLNESVGVLTWMNQLQLHWEAGNKDIPDNMRAQIFEGRTGVRPRPATQD